MQATVIHAERQKSVCNMATTVTEDDEGKRVVRGDDTVGRVVNVERGTAYVDPDPDLTDTVKSKLGWGDEKEDAYPLQEDMIDAITDDEILLEGTL